MDFNLYPKDDADRAYKEGQWAREEEKPRSANPYKADTVNADEWETGWDDLDADLAEDDEGGRS